jgi:hypothetical protein
MHDHFHYTTRFAGYAWNSIYLQQPRLHYTSLNAPQEDATPTQPFSTVVGSSPMHLRIVARAERRHR